MIVIIDYGVGNVNALFTVFNNLNIPAKVSSDISDIQNSSKLILPGVGAYDYAMEKLNRSGMRDILDEQVLIFQKHVLGICVGMQMLARDSDEGNCDGLGWIDAHVKKININYNISNLSIPHMGWNNIEISNNNALFNNIHKESYFYFLHSYYFDTQDKEIVLSTTEYGNRFASSVNKGNIYGVQFHPEKSHQSGIQLLKNFSEL